MSTNTHTQTWHRVFCVDNTQLFQHISTILTFLYLFYSYIHNSIDCCLLIRFPQFIFHFQFVCQNLMIHLINRKRIHNLFETDENDPKKSSISFFFSVFFCSLAILSQNTKQKEKNMLLIFWIAKDKCSLEFGQRRFGYGNFKQLKKNDRLNGHPTSQLTF